MRSFLTIAAVLGLLGAGPQPAFAQLYGPAPSSTWGWAICIGTASIGPYNNAPRTCSPVIAGFATRTRALSRGIDGPIAISAA